VRQNVRKSRADAAAALGTPNSVWRGTAEAADALSIVIGGENSIASRETRSVSRVRGFHLWSATPRFPIGDRLQRCCHSGYGNPPGKAYNKDVTKGSIAWVTLNVRRMTR